jgi:hypothetical protein
MSVPGMTYPTQKGMPAGNPRDSAMANMNNNAQLQANANKAMAGGRFKRHRKYRGGNSIVVPQFNMPYEPQGGPGTNPNNQIQQNASTSTQGAANSKFDGEAFKKGGTRRKKGGNPDWIWGCSSGGRKKRTRRSRRSRRSRKSRKY